jgi:hypothetical protein
VLVLPLWSACPLSAARAHRPAWPPRRTAPAAPRPSPP